MTLKLELFVVLVLHNSGLRKPVQHSNTAEQAGDVGHTRRGPGQGMHLIVTEMGCNVVLQIFRNILMKPEEMESPSFEYIFFGLIADC